MSILSAIRNLFEGQKEKEEKQKTELELFEEQEKEEKLFESIRDELKEIEDSLKSLIESIPKHYTRFEKQSSFLMSKAEHDFKVIYKRYKHVKRGSALLSNNGRYMLRLFFHNIELEIKTISKLIDIREEEYAYSK
jgi:predicted  nucleic acid-binding Zn-ribbon protein